MYTIPPMSTETEVRMIKNREWQSLFGGCHIFSLAAQRLTGWPLGAVLRMDSDEDDNKESGLICGGTNIVHVFLYMPDGKMYDAVGARDLNEYVGEKGLELGWELDSAPIDEADIDTMVAQGWLGRYSKNIIAAAISDIRQDLIDGGYQLLERHVINETSP